MKTLKLNGFSLDVDFTAGQIISLRLSENEMISSRLPLFTVGLRDLNGKAYTVSASDAKAKEETEFGGLYEDFSAVLPSLKNMSARVFLNGKNGEAEWRISVSAGDASMLVEWIDLVPLCLPRLRDNAEGGGEILFPYNEGALISNVYCREETSLRQADPEYPSKGCFAVFPNMICSQFIAYLLGDAGLYIGAHDPARAVKGIDYIGTDDGVILRTRLFSGVSYGEDFSMDYPLVFAATDGGWEGSAERYRQWFESALPPKAKKIKDNPDIPDWYEDSPLVVSYPVRGFWDADVMTPNALFPYTNALPLINEVKEKTDARLLVLLMHWEGTAPWAPPYVWPPYGGTENFNEFKDILHKNGDMLGVYCSGFGYTLRSNLVDDYECASDYEKRGLEAGMCASPEGKVEISRICTTQRSGYDVCPASKVGKEILKEAYFPLFESGIDYAQILDQNHGGGQYFCYSREHGHPHAPGKWMTESMQNMLSEWNEKAGKMLLGCESAAGESFIGNLLFSDNRFELNYILGRPVPLYAYIYHEYLRNFMGNQVSCPFMPDDDTLPYRIAYSFSIGDCMTLVFSPAGNLLPNWGRPRYTVPPCKEKVLKFVSNLTRFYRGEAHEFLYCGRMIKSPKIECEQVVLDKRISETKVELPAILSSAWENSEGKRALILVNPAEREAVCRVDGKEITVPALDATIIYI